MMSALRRRGGRRRRGIYFLLEKKKNTGLELTQAGAGNFPGGCAQELCVSRTQKLPHQEMIDKQKNRWGLIVCLFFLHLFVVAPYRYHLSRHLERGLLF